MRLTCPPPSFLVAVAVIVVFECGFGVVAAESHKSDAISVSERMRFYDRIYASAFTARGTLVKPPPFNAADTPPLEQEWVLTRSGNAVGLHQKSVGLQITYRAKTPDDRPSSYDKQGNMWLTTNTEDVIWFGEDRSAWLVVSTSFNVSPDNAILSKGTSKTLRIAAAEAPKLRVPVNSTLWVLGRGYTDYIDQILQVEENGERLKVVADGSFDGSIPGRWTLAVTPNDQYVVTAAEFRRRNLNDGSFEQEPFVRVSNDRLVTESGCVYPSNGDFTVANLKTTFAVHNAALKSDNDLLGDLQRMSGKIEAGSLVQDYRSSPPRYFREGSQPQANVKVQPSSSRLWLILLNVLIVVALLVTVVMIRVRKRHHLS
jgi:hypothetical protein